MPDFVVPDGIPGRVPVDDVTRVVVVTDDGVKEFWADEWGAYLQDDGCTLKLFPRGNGNVARITRQQSLIELFKDDLARAQRNQVAQLRANEDLQ